MVIPVTCKEKKVDVSGCCVNSEYSELFQTWWMIDWTIILVITIISDHNHRIIWRHNFPQIPPKFGPSEANYISLQRPLFWKFSRYRKYCQSKFPFLLSVEKNYLLPQGKCRVGSNTSNIQGVNGIWCNIRVAINNQLSLVVSVPVKCDLITLIRKRFGVSDKGKG